MQIQYVMTPTGPMRLGDLLRDPGAMQVFIEQENAVGGRAASPVSPVCAAIRRAERAFPSRLTDHRVGFPYWLR